MFECLDPRQAAEVSRLRLEGMSELVVLLSWLWQHVPGLQQVVPAGLRPLLTWVGSDTTDLSGASSLALGLNSVGLRRAATAVEPLKRADKAARLSQRQQG
jgi:hypothetical protein